ncbi:hypothetical protein Taro_044993 [Colocasia esculenta]|uniref:Protein SEH1 n=1 Tax=Colocasia esculenta TaxID=4460 RepID=A0A843WZC2_COLES|nr:hypothetical protein [Colocasia esculenta]
MKGVSPFQRRIPLASLAAASPGRVGEPWGRFGEMEKAVATLGEGAACCDWNYCGQRIAVGYADGGISVHDSPEPGSSSSFTRSSKWRAHESGIKNVIWVPPEYGDAIACVCVDGKMSLWEEVAEDSQTPTWKLCKTFESNAQVLDLQFGVSLTSLKLKSSSNIPIIPKANTTFASKVAAYSDGSVKVHELLDPLALNKWQLQAEFQNVTDSVSRFGRPSCISASIAWSPRTSESQLLRFVLGFNTDLPQFNSSKIWEFDEVHQRWLPVAELALPGDKGDRVHAVAWAPNIGRPYELIAVATCKGIAIWHLGLTPDFDGRLSTEKVALLSGHDHEVWQLEWDMSGMTLASTGADGMVRIWQSNLNGVWHEQAILDCNATQRNSKQT